MGSGILGVLPKTAPFIFNKGESEMQRKAYIIYRTKSTAEKHAKSSEKGIKSAMVKLVTVKKCKGGYTTKFTKKGMMAKKLLP